MYFALIDRWLEAFQTLLPEIIDESGGNKKKSSAVSWTRSLVFVHKTCKSFQPEYKENGNGRVLVNL